MTPEQMRDELLKRHYAKERLSKAENEQLGLYHRVGAGKKLNKPISEYQFTTAPNPKVNMAPEKLISPEDLYGGLGMPLIGDSSMAGRLLTGAEGHEFHQPVELEGGHDYMRANALHKDKSKRAIWASGKGEVTGILKKAKYAAEEGKPMYGIHASMSPSGVDFSHMPVEVLAELVKNSKITKKAQNEFNKEMRTRHPDFPGVMHEELHDMLRAPGAGELRKHFVERMATDPYQEAGFPEIAMARLAVQHPNLMKYDQPSKVFVGSSIGKFNPDFSRVTDPVHPHHSYPDVIGGEYVGAFHPESSEPLLTTQDLFPEFHQMRREFNAPEQGDRRSFERSKPVQKFDQEWLDRVMPIYLARRKSVLGYADGGDVKQPSIDEMQAALALNPMGESALAKVNRKAGPAHAFMADLQKAGMKPAEMEARGLHGLQGDITREQLAQHLASTPAPHIIEDHNPDKTYEKYTIPGGSNYREMLLQHDPMEAQHYKIKEFPANKWLPAQYHILNQHGQYAAAARTPEEAQQQIAKLPKMKAPREQEPFFSEHYEAPNIIAHMRLKDRTGPNGERILHAEEIQSDWHQKGKEHGYKTYNMEDQVDAAHTAAHKARLLANDPNTPYDVATKAADDYERLSDHAHKLQHAMEHGVPDAPFKDTWHELALKHLLNHAVKGGYDKVAITPGQEQAGRYDLSKHVDRLEYFPESNNLVAMKDGKIMTTETVDPDKLGNMIGKEAAKKLLEQKPIPAKRVGEKSMHLLESQELQIGGEGMRNFYDKKIPSALNKIGKRFGAQVQPGMVETEPAQQGQEPGFPAYHRPAQYAPVHEFHITPELREHISKQGLPMFAGGGDVALQDVGAEEAPSLGVKEYILPHGQHPGQLPVGGIDMQPAVPGVQLWPTQPPAQQPQQGQQQPPQGAQPPQGGPAPQGGPQGPQPTSLSNILQMTPQGRALGAMQPPQAAKKGGTIKPVGFTKEKVTVSPNLDAMQYELMSVKHFKKAK